MSKLLHIVMLKRPVNLFMAENNSESIDVDPPPTPTQTHLERLPVAADGTVRSGWVGAGGWASFAVREAVVAIEAQAVDFSSK